MSTSRPCTATPRAAEQACFLTLPAERRELACGPRDDSEKRRRTVVFLHASADVVTREEPTGDATKQFQHSVCSVCTMWGGICGHGQGWPAQLIHPTGTNVQVPNRVLLNRILTEQMKHTECGNSLLSQMSPDKPTEVTTKTPRSPMHTHSTCQRWRRHSMRLTSGISAQDAAHCKDRSKD